MYSTLPLECLSSSNDLFQDPMAPGIIYAGSGKTVDSQRKRTGDVARFLKECFEHRNLYLSTQGT